MSSSAKWRTGRRASRAKSIWRAAIATGARAGSAGIVRHRTVLGIVKHPGAFREFLTLPVANLHRVPKSIPD